MNNSIVVFHALSFLWAPVERTPSGFRILSVCLVCLFVLVFFPVLAIRPSCDLQVRFTKLSNYYSLLQKNSLSRTLRLHRSLTRGMMLSSCVTSSALRHPQSSGNTREPRFSLKKMVRGALSLLFPQSSFPSSTRSSSPLTQADASSNNSIF